MNRPSKVPRISAECVRDEAEGSIEEDYFNNGNVFFMKPEINDDEEEDSVPAKAPSIPSTSPRIVKVEPMEFQRDYQGNSSFANNVSMATTSQRNPSHSIPNNDVLENRQTDPLELLSGLDEQMQKFFQEANSRFDRILKEQREKLQELKEHRDSLEASRQADKAAREKLEKEVEAKERSVSCLQKEIMEDTNRIEKLKEKRSLAVENFEKLLYSSMPN